MPNVSVERAWEALYTVQNLHSSRSRDVDGATLRWCVECQQNWPCATVQAIEEVMG